MTLLSSVLALTACGGGGGGGAAEPPAALRVTISAQDTNLLSNKGEIFYEAGTEFATSLTINVNQANGQAVGNGTSVGLSVSDSALGALSTTDDLRTQTASLTVPTTAGVASAVFHTRERTGQLTVTASVSDPAANQTRSATVTISVAEGPDGVRRVTLSATRLSLPARPVSVPVFFDSPYLSEVNIEYREADGTLGAPADGEVGVGINPVTTAAFSTLDDPQTEDINEFFVLLGNGPVELAGGTGKAFVHSFDSPGLVTVTVSATDANTGEIFDDTLEIEIVDPASDGRPASVEFALPNTPQYAAGSGGTTAQSFEVFVSDGAGEPVDDPTPGNNNVLLQVFTESPASGAVLRGVGSGGTIVEGTSINLSTTNGITSASLVSGSEPGIVRIRAVADAADNITSNGVDAEIRSETSVVISDGIPHSVTITSFPINSLIVNPVDPATVIIDEVTGLPIEPNATYSLRVNAIVTDRFGNPPAQPTALQVGLVDAPISGFPTQGAGIFDISGLDGDPEEGGTNFHARVGFFTTAGGGAGPDDTLLVFGKDVPGNADLESARTVQQVIDTDDLIVDEPFNFNDTTGGSVDNGEVLPYIIGRATVGNIESNVATDSNGVATTFMNYPVSQLGRTAAIYFQGTNGALGSSGNIRTFADAEVIRYPGLAPLRLVATPASIPSNVATSVLLCVEDAASVPVRGQFIGFAFAQLDGVGTVDGQAGTGTVLNPTGADGCTVAQVETSGVGTDADDGLLNFFTGEASDDVVIAPPNSAVLQAEPSFIVTGGGTATFTITLRYLSNGRPVSDIGISGECEITSGTGGIIDQPELTDANGEATSRISVFLNDGTFGSEVGSGSCTYTAADGTEAVVDLQGFDVCANQVNVSPAPPPGACDDDGTSTAPEATVTVSYSVTPPVVAAGQANISGNVGTLSCDYDFTTGAQSGTCSISTNSTAITINLTEFTPPAGVTFQGWTGACSSAGTATSATISLVPGSTNACTAVYQ
ncbi:MAG: hypothetical protein QNJ40_22305 [Xanthomonadales bacterium]|nr:hypothetical protein [Xanthomonadales bacterium]